jgi:hypothetical protein
MFMVAAVAVALAINYQEALLVPGLELAQIKMGIVLEMVVLEQIMVLVVAEHTGLVLQAQELQVQLSWLCRQTH